MGRITQTMWIRESKPTSWQTLPNQVPMGPMSVPRGLGLLTAPRPFNALAKSKRPTRPLRLRLARPHCHVAVISCSPSVNDGKSIPEDFNGDALGSTASQSAKNMPIKSIFLSSARPTRYFCSWPFRANGERVGAGVGWCRENEV